jgi:hypothetical protein
MIRKTLALALLATLAGSALALAGGQATIKVVDMPKSFVAGETVTVSFTVHDAVGKPLSRLEPTLVAQLGRRRIEVPAVPVKMEGGYQAAVKLPSAGEWTLTVDSKYCGNTNVMRGVQVLAAK